MATTVEHEHQVLRYRTKQRIVHALLATSFVVLLLTGLVLLWDPLGWLAAGGWSRLIHRIGAIGFLAVPAAYLILDRKGARELVYDSFRYDRDDIEWFKTMYRYFLGHAVEMPPQGRLNAGQKLHHAAVMLVSATVVVSGLAMWFFKPQLGASGLAAAAVIHDLSMLALTLFLIGHLYFTYVYKAISGMTTGWVEEADARLEHSKWMDELDAQAEAVTVGSGASSHDEVSQEDQSQEDQSQEG
ncbi:MAG: cytochrome b/b6 domain-containing protein [Acidimicrobiia bacterium]|nr:cytochrome b/b6 domain-containing protein [Acidimicrobiia bacterium]